MGSFSVHQHVQSVCVSYLVLKEQHYILWTGVQSFLQVRGELLLPNDVTGWRNRLVGQGNSGGESEKILMNDRLEN